MNKFSLLFLSVFATLFGEEVEHLGSGGSFGVKIIERLTSDGVLKLNGTTIQDLRVTGSLMATSAVLGELQVLGEANIRGSRVSQNCSVLGSLRAQDTYFDGSVTLDALKVVFTGCNLQGITVRKPNGFKGKQVIELKQGTVVNGPIVFEAGKGEVHCYGSNYTGQVTGGKVIKKN